MQTFDNQPSGGPSVSSNPTRARSPRTMSQISGFKRPLMHTNSFTSDRLPVYGVETPHEATLGVMLNDINTWGIDIFKIGTLSCNRPLTCVAYQIFQVRQLANRFSPPQSWIIIFSHLLCFIRSTISKPLKNFIFGLNPNLRDWNFRLRGSKIIITH